MKIRRPASSHLPYLVCVLAFLGLTWSMLHGFQPRISQNAASDFKTVYASAWCFHHDLDAYSFANLAKVFRDNGVVQPASWYAHSPVYPPFTLALLWPITWLPMVLAIYVWILASTLAMAVATMFLVQASARLALPVSLQLLVPVLVAASPLLVTGLELANVFVIAAALCIVVVASPDTGSEWMKAIAMTLALLLKPHLAFWIVLALVFRFHRAQRNIVYRVCVLLLVFLCAFTSLRVLHPMLFAQFTGYRHIVLAELGAGSMSPGNRDVLTVSEQMTPLSVLLGYWQVPSMVSTASLLMLGALLVWTCWKGREDPRTSPLFLAGLWSAFGMVATYHRQADAAILVMLLPVVLKELQGSTRSIWAWGTLTVLCAGALGPSAHTIQHLLQRWPAQHALQAILLRQATFASMALLLLLLGRAVHDAHKRRMTH